MSHWQETYLHSSILSDIFLDVIHYSQVIEWGEGYWAKSEPGAHPLSSNLLTRHLRHFDWQTCLRISHWRTSRCWWKQKKRCAYLALCLQDHPTLRSMIVEVSWSEYSRRQTPKSTSSEWKVHHSNHLSELELSLLLHRALLIVHHHNLTMFS